MDSTKNYQYYVIEFAGPPYPDLYRYVCIPDSWIKLREIKNQTVVVKYPMEKHTLTKKLVKRGEAYSEHWSMYVAYVIYGTDRYEDAKKYTKQINSDFKKRSYTSDTEEDNKCSAISKNNLRKFERNHSSKNQDSSNKTLSGKPLTAETANANKEYTRGLPKLLALLTEKNDNKSQPICKKSLFVKSNTLPKFNEEPINVDRIQESDSTTPESTIKLLNPQPSFEISVMSLMKELLNSFEGSRAMLKKIVNIFNDHIPINRNDSVGLSEDSSAIFVSKENENEGTEIEEATENVRPQEEERIVLTITKGDNGVLKRKLPEKESSEENQVPLKKIRARSRSLTLPLDYDKNDTKWTLRYREPASGLVELIKSSGVYVNDIKLRNCIRLSKDSKTLTRMLFVEVFSDTALRTCSLIGSRVWGSKTYRPRFDENARTTLSKYVEQYASENKWVKQDARSILISLRNKINNIRNRHSASLDQVTGPASAVTTSIEDRPAAS